LGLDRTAALRGLREVVCIAGAVDSFAEAAEVVLRKLAGVRVSESTVQRTSEAVGQEISRRVAAGETFGEARRKSENQIPSVRTEACELRAGSRWGLPPSGRVRR
jgi:hypothetical protein